MRFRWIHQCLWIFVKWLRWRFLMYWLAAFRSIFLFDEELVDIYEYNDDTKVSLFFLNYIIADCCWVIRGWSKLNSKFDSQCSCQCFSESCACVWWFAVMNKTRLISKFDSQCSCLKNDKRQHRQILCVLNKDDQANALKHSNVNFQANSFAYDWSVIQSFFFFCFFANTIVLNQRSD